MNRFFFLLILIFLFQCKVDNPLNAEKKSNNEEILSLTFILAGFDLQEEARNKIGLLSQVVPGSENDTREQIVLGEKIFRDTSLSLNSVQSCSTCHLLNGRNVGTDGQATSLGTFGQSGKRNTPSIFNVGYLKTIFWDGRKSTLSEQALLPFVDASEMALGSTSDLLDRLNAKTEYASLFSAAFPKNPTIQLTNVNDAITAFERSLVSKTRFDDFIGGNPFAITLQEKEGLRLFLNLNCINCHDGPMLGGKKFVKLDSKYNYNKNDLGRFEFTGVEADKYFFRTPSLRNVEITPPYFHDGSVRTLEEAIRRMNEYEAPRTITEAEIASLATFLKSLSDKSKVNF